MSFWKKPAESAGYLSGVAFFEGFSNEDLARVASLSGELKVGSGAMVIDQGDTGVDCYVIMEGTASVRVRDEEVATLGSGDMLGEMALIDHRPRTASVVATTDMHLLRFNSRQFRQLLTEMPKAEERVMTMLTERLRAEGGPSNE
ncbi:MAG: cyclic nucleotide-binding domain-containing protein [Candidatus Microthrix sp.]|uniref:Crp/Fnr family transcriptional regulator n=1 Tax=Candidatus Neomicrothrix sp. TaxID=2719034 RepID=UPI0025C0F4D1|nr:cyclic nucleotide-binding domain-containing protein [Candidatus Microthrix sp.]MBL0206200.1 cyclic nucleotide-binding domain-containing protein [Candidatus Microthrix sp.]